MNMMNEIDPRIGSQAMDFTLLNDQEQPASLHDMVSEKGLLLTFIHGTWCVSCVQTLYRLRQYEKIYAQEGFFTAVVAIDSPSALNVFRLSAHPPLNIPLLSDENETVHHAYELHHVGAYLVLDHNLVICERFLDSNHQGWPGHFRILEAMRKI